MIVIRENMGHKSVKTTETYILRNEKHLKNYRSPLESFIDTSNSGLTRVS